MRWMIAVLAVLVPTVARADEPSHRPLGIALISPAEIFHGKDTVIVGASVNLIYGRSRAVYGVEVGLVNVVDGDVGFLQIGGLANVADGGCYGVCAAGLVNLHGSLVGFQLAPFGNEAGEIPFGFQVGLFNVIRANATMAVQIGLTNINNRRFADLMALMGAKQGDVVTVHLHAGTQRGLQIGLINGSDDYRGLRIAALMNVGERGKGIEIAPLANVASSWSGLQVGLWNHATTMHGLQIGLINTARDLEGIQIGAINIATANTIPFTVLVNAGF